MPAAGGPETALRLYLRLLGGLWGVTLSIGCIERFLLHWPLNHWYFFVLVEAHFTDFTIFQPRFQHFGQSDFFSLRGYPFTYPAPVALVFQGFYFFGAPAFIIYLLSCFAVCLGAGAALAYAMYRRGAVLLDSAIFIGASFLLSYPFWFMVERANIEFASWVAIALGVTCYWKRYWFAAATCFGLAASLKIYPFVYIALMLSARRYAATAWSLVVAAGVTAGSTFLLGPSFRASAAGIAKGLDWIRQTYGFHLRPVDIGFDHSLFALVKRIALPAAPNPAALLDIYMVFAAAFGLGLYAWKIRNLPRANQILALTVCAILLPPLSFDYTLIDLYIPWAVLVLIAVSGNRAAGRGIMFSLICMAILMAPESFLFFDGIIIAGQFKAVVLMALLAVSVVYPIEEPALERSGAPAKTSNAAQPLAIPPR